jgi:hypothetical protein
MSSGFVRLAQCLTATCTAAAVIGCSDSVAPPSATRDASTLRAAALPVANATVQVLPGLDGAHPRSINEFEEVVGSTAAGLPFYWSPSKGLILMQHGSYANAEPASINDRGVMAGTANFSVPATWQPGGSFRALQKPANQNCTVHALTFDGLIVGTCLAGTTSYGTKFPWQGMPTETSGYRYNSISDDQWLGGAQVSGGNPTAPIIISPSGQVTVLHGHDGAVHPGEVTFVATRGWSAGYSNEGGCAQAVAWFFTGDHVTWPEYRLGTCGFATGVTTDWYVVGISSGNWAFLWYPGPGLQRLPGLGGSGETSAAMAISLHHALGTITSNGVTHTVIWNLPNRS